MSSWDKVERDLQNSVDIVVAALLQGRGRRAIDGGAYKGFFARLLPPFFQHVEMFEPNGFVHPALTANTYVYDCMTLHPEGLSNKAGYARLGNPDASNRDFFYLREDTGPVSLVPLDEFAFRDVDLIKLNIEGMELAALHGSRQTIARCRPLILVEEKGHGERFGVSAGSIAAFLAPFGYLRTTRSKGMWLYATKKKGA